MCFEITSIYTTERKSELNIPFECLPIGTSIGLLESETNFLKEFGAQKELK